MSHDAYAKLTSVRRRLRNLLVSLALLSFAAAGIALLPGQARALSLRWTGAKRVAVTSGIPQLSGVVASTPRFLAAVREKVPSRDHIRLLEGGSATSPPVCVSLRFFFLAYELLPRAAVCDASPRWWVLYRTRGLPLPPGSKVIVDISPDLRLVDTRPQRAP